MNKKLIVIQARMGSSRLPGKVLKKVLGRPLLEFQVERLSRSSLADGVIVATSNRDIDSEIEEFCDNRRISCFRGDEIDLSERILGAANNFGANLVVRVTADCPLIDPETVDSVIQLLEEKDYDYVTTDLVANYPNGMGCEGFYKKGLIEVYNEALGDDRENVTSYFRRYPDRFKLGGLPQVVGLSHYRWTVDTPQDFELVRLIIEHLYPENREFKLADILSLVKKNPEWMKINADVQQKTGPHSLS